MIDHTATTALIIGGTQGLGQAIAQELVERGCTRIVVAGRDAERGQVAAEQLGATYLPVDLSDAEAVIDLVTQSAARFGSLTALVNAAATTDRASVLDCSISEWDRQFATNSRGPFFAIQRLAQLAIAAKYPASVVNILTMASYVGQSFLAPYSASKAALANVTRNAAQALRTEQIRVNGINCGWMDTPGEDLIQRKWHDADDNWLAAAEAQQPFGMLIKPPHVATLASYMLSTQSGVMTGSVVDFDQYVAGAYPE